MASSNPSSTPEAQLLAKARILVEAGFFDENYYAEQFATRPGQDLFAHFFFHGYREGRRPNPVFDTRWYLSTYADVALSGLNPLLDYVLFGEKAGRNPSPLFDSSWYRERYRLGAATSPLMHYLLNRHGPFSPIAEFDADYYLAANPEVAAARYDPFAHYCLLGFKQGLNPSADFDTSAYRRRFMKHMPEVNPLLHYRVSKKEPDFRPVVAKAARTSYAEVKKFTRPGQDFAEFSALAGETARRAKLLAIYLPWFHGIEDKDQSFSDWATVIRGQPRFADHYQPRIPRDLGFHALDDIDAMRRQAAMARAAGIFGFVFSCRGFGERLSERRVENFLAAPDIDIPFCLLWANKDRTEILVGNDQGFDDEKLCAELARHFRDPRHIRVNGRPLMMVARPIPAASVAKWRRIFHERFDENPVLVMSQRLSSEDPRPHGLDGAVEFLPHKLRQGQRPINASVEMFDPNFNGDILAYDNIVAASLDEPTPDFPLIKTIIPGWDDDPLREGSGLSIHGASPGKYESWLGELVERAGRRRFFGEAFVCVNAWNAWTEGAALEPDVHYGAAYLNATARAVADAPGVEIASDRSSVDAPVAAQISVVILNDNHAKHLEARLDSIFNQDHPVLEVIILDDASTDNSFDVIEQVAERRERDLTLIINERHSGSAFEQWERAVETATGEFIWIAEADDLTAPSFLSRLAEAMRRDPRIGFAFCDSRSIDSDDRPLSESNKPYDAEVEPAALAADALFEGADFLARFLSVKDLVLSVSGVLWRREILARALAACKDDLVNFGVAGDWRLYGECCATPDARIGYVADPLSCRRRPAQSATRTLGAQIHVDQIAAMQAFARRTCDLPAPILAKQAAYLDEIRAELLGAPEDGDNETEAV